MNLVDLNGQLLEQIQVTACHVTEQPDDFFEKLARSHLIRNRGLGRSPGQVV